MCLRTSDKMKISHKLAIRREVGAIAPPPPPPHRNFSHCFGPVNFIFGPVNFIFGPINFIFGPVNFIFGQLILSLGQLILSLGQFILSLGELILSFGQVILSRRKFSFRGGGAKLHEFPTLHRSARFTIAYCFTKTTLGHI